MSNNDPALTPESDLETVRARQMALEHHIKSSPTDRSAFLELAGIYRGQMLLPRAVQILKQAQELFPDDPDVLWDFEETQLSRSLQQLTEVRKLVVKTSNPEADQTLERCLVDWANTRIRVCRARLQRDPTRMNLRLVLGEAYYDLEKFEEAIEELEPATESETHGSAAYYWLGRCHALCGRDTEAMRCLRAASLRRSVTTPVKVRIAALQMLIDLAERHGLAATLQHYQQHLQKSLSEESSTATAT